MNQIENIRAKFKLLHTLKQYRGDTIEIQNASFACNHNSIFGKPNDKYIAAEIEWYKSQSLNINDLERLYGSPVQIWRDVCSDRGYINSNYGWCIFSKINGNQYANVEKALRKDELTRQAVMYYTRPEMHTSATVEGMHDHICTTHVQYFLNGDYLDASVYMRSNDAVFGFNNDYAWQRYVQKRLAHDLGVEPGRMIWNAGSLHVYKRHWDLLCG